METDLMYQMYELEQNKLRHQKMDEISKTNLQITVNFAKYILILNLLFIKI